MEEWSHILLILTKKHPKMKKCGNVSQVCEPNSSKSGYPLEVHRRGELQTSVTSVE